MEKLKIEDFELEFIDVIERLAGALKVKPAVMLENIFIRRLAEERAADDVYGKRPHLMPEFMLYGGEVKRGHELYEILYHLERDTLEKDRLKQIQSTGIPFEMLPAEDQEIMRRFNQDPESKKLQEIADREADEILKDDPIIIEWTNKKE